jgi:hypothetical protein
MQTTKVINPHPHIVPCVNMWSVTFLFLFFFLYNLLNVACIRPPHCPGRPSGVDHTHISFVLLHNVTCYTNSIISHIHVKTTEFRDIMCTLVATRALHWVPIPMPTHAHGFWVGMGAMLLFMGGHGWAWVRYYCSWVGIGFCVSLHPAPNRSQTSRMQGIR